MPLDDDYLAAAERRARRFSGAYTGTSGTLAADVIRLLNDRRELVRSLEEMNRELRGAVEARLAVKAAVPNEVITPVAPPPRFTLIAFAGRIESGKSTAAGMIPGAVHFQWADPLYAMLAAMLGVDEAVLRDRKQKDSTITLPGGIVVTPRRLLETLGTEWGRDLIHPDLWVSLTLRRIEAVQPGTPVAVCGTRFPNEIAAVRERGGEVWWIDRPGSNAGTSHSSGRMIGPSDCDAVVRNDGDIETLRGRVLSAWEDYLDAST